MSVFRQIRAFALASTLATGSLLALGTVSAPAAHADTLVVSGQESNVPADETPNATRPPAGRSVVKTAQPSERPFIIYPDAEIFD